jgi:O-antigen/teichoic acid export membrane protein
MTTVLQLARHSALSLVMYLAARVANVVIFIVLSRTAGPDQAGVLSLGLTYLLVFSVLTRGLDELVTRQTARKPEKSSHYFGSFLLLRAFLSVLLYFVLIPVVFLFIDYSDETRLVIAVMGLGMVPDSLAAVGQAVLLGRGEFGTPTLVAVITSVIRLAGGSLVLVLGGSTIHLAVIWTLGALTSMILLMILAWRLVGPPRRRDWIDPSFLSENLRPALPFLLISVLLAFEFQLDVILLSILRDEAQVGYYSAATTVTATVAVLSHAYRMAVYPLMARYQSQTPSRLEHLYLRSMRWLGILVLPMATGIALLSPQIVNLLYTTDFEPTVPTLRILSWSLIFTFLIVPNTRMMYVRDRQRYTFIFLCASMVTNTTLNLILDGPLGASGAALARVCSSMVFFGAGYLYVNRILLASNLFHLLYKSALATLGMAAVVWLMRSWPLAVTVVAGATVYGGMLLMLGGIRPADLALVRRIINGLGPSEDKSQA